MRNKSILVAFLDTERFGFEEMYQLNMLCGFKLPVLDIDRFAREAANQIDLSKRRYGIGTHFLAPLGFYHPSVIEDRLIGNVTRGRLVKKKPLLPLYIYDYDEQGELVQIVSNETHQISFREAEDQCEVFYTFDVNPRRTPEINALTLIQREAERRIRKWIRFVWTGHLKFVVDVRAEICAETPNGSICTRYMGGNDSYGCLRFADSTVYRLVQDDAGKTIRVEALPETPNS